MATKPTDKFTWATDTNFASGPDSGNPTKAVPPGYPVVAQGFVPNLGIVAAYMNKALNVLGGWLTWLDSGSSAGAADAHLVETDASGDTAVQNLEVNDTSITFVESPAAVDISVSKITGTGATAGVAAVLEGQPGQDQTGANDNNNGGRVDINAGDRGTGGSGTGGDGFGGDSLAGAITMGFDGLNDTARIWRFAEGWDKNTSPVRVMTVPLPHDKATYVVDVTASTIESGAGTSLEYGIVRTVFAVKREGTTLTISAGTDLFDIYSAAATQIAVSLTDPSDGTLEINVSTATPHTDDGNCYVTIYPSRISAV
jgi:hypothetical protein